MKSKKVAIATEIVAIFVNFGFDVFHVYALSLEWGKIVLSRFTPICLQTLIDSPSESSVNDKLSVFLWEKCYPCL